MLKITGLYSLLLLSTSLSAVGDTRSTILEMEQACTGAMDDNKAASLEKHSVQCRPTVNHGGAATPQTLIVNTLSKSDQAINQVIEQYRIATVNKNTKALANLLAEDFSIIQPGGNAWDKKTYMNSGVAHLMTMFTDLSFDIMPVRINTTEQSAIAIVSYRLGGLHMGKPATTFGLGTISLIKRNDEWLIQHIHNSGIQVY